MKNVLVALLLLACPLTAFGACSGSISGKSATVGIDISDGGCAYDSDHIIFWKMKPDGSPADGPEQHVPFDEECKFTKAGFSCRSGGRTPLAGTSYKLETHGKDVCDETGNTPGKRYRCVKGCKRSDAPMYLYPEPYEC